MKKDLSGKGIDIALLVTGLFFLSMGLTDLDQDLFGTLLGLSLGIPLLGVFVWRKVRRSQGKIVKVNGECITLFIFALFFLAVGFSNMVRERSSVILGLCIGLPLAVLYVLRRRADLKAAEKAAAEKLEADRKRASAMPYPPAETPLTLCPHCGAPSKGKVCPYCGLGK